MAYQPYQSTWNNPYLAAQGQPIMPSVQPYQQPVNGITKVNGRDSAMQYQLPPNSMSPALFDQNGQTFYIVSTDGTGTKTIEAFDFKPHVEEQPVTIDGVQFVSRAEFDEFAAKVNAVLEARDGIYATVPEGGPADPGEPADGDAKVNPKRGHGGARKPAGEK